MKFSKQTLTILKNFASVNTNLLLKPGKMISTKGTDGSMIATADIEEEIPCQFGIYDLNEFLGVISIFSDPEINITEKEMVISEGKNKIRYLSAESSILITPKNPRPPLPEDAEVNFVLTQSELGQIIRAASVLKVPFMSVIGNGSTMTIKVHDKSNVNSNAFTLDKGDTEHTFVYNIRVDLLKMLPEDYEVTIAKTNTTRFVGNNKTYWVMCETDSSFGA
jgi:hypothetical protein